MLLFVAIYVGLSRHIAHVLEWIIELVMLLDLMPAHTLR